MRNLRIWILSASLCWLPIVGTGLIVGAGCQGCTTSQKTVAYKTLNIVATSVDAGMKAFTDAVVAGKIPQATQDKVKELHGRYQKALQAAIAAARFDTSQVAPESLQALAGELLTLITEAVRYREC